jgi:hypothetical protein
MLTFYCSWIACSKHFDTHHPDALPDRCPHCHREAWWEPVPPPFEAVLTQQDRVFLKMHHIGVRALIAS